MTPGPVRLVVFDIDDTMYLERDYVRSGFQAVGERVRGRLGIEGFSDRAWDAFLVGRRDTIFDSVLRASGISPDPELIGDLVDAYRSHVPAISLLPDARSCFERINGRATIAVLTDGPLASQQAKADALELRRWAAPIVFTAELGAGLGKPSTHGFRLLESQTGFAGAACAYVADNPAKDFLGPRALGWRTVRVRRPGGLHERMESGADVDVEVSDLDRLEGILFTAPMGTAPSETRR